MIPTSRRGTDIGGVRVYIALVFLGLIIRGLIGDLLTD